MSSQSKSEKPVSHTPGPWRIEKQPSYSPHRIYVFGADGHQITYFQERKRGSHRGEEATWLGFMPGDEEDARLIAAAPRIYEALHRMMVHFYGKDEPACLECGANLGTGEGCDSCYVWTCAEAAIAAAEGREL